jgi:hypothetical protein
MMRRKLTALVLLCIGIALLTTDATGQTAVPADPTITSGPENPTNSQDATFAFESDLGATFLCKLDAELDFTECSSPQAYTGLSEGAHTFRVKAVLVALESGVTSYAWTIDTSAPVTTITAKPSDPSADSSPSFSFTSSEAGSSFECQLDGGAFAACASPKGYTGLAGGAHTFSVRASDAAGNTDPTPASYAWTIDTSAPVTTITSGPDTPTTVTSASFSFASTEAGSTFNCQLDAGSFAACASPKGYTGLADGSHTFQVRASDAAGNTDATPASYTWTIDATAPPDPTIAAKPANPTTSQTAHFSFSDSEAAVSFVCALDGVASACTSPKNYVGPLVVGPHTFQVRAKDGLGNLSGPASYSWTIDLTPPPAPTIDTRPADLLNATSAPFTFSDSEPGATFLCSLDEAPFVACTSPRTYSSLGDGAHTFNVEAKDAAGNESLPTSDAWTVDTSAPTVTLSSPADGSVTSATTPEISGSADTGPADTSNVSVELFTSTGTPLESLSAVVNSPSGAWSVLSPALAEGTYSARATQTDTFGRTGSSLTTTFRIDTSVPSVTIARPATGTLTKNPRPIFSGTAGTADGDLSGVTVAIHNGGTADDPVVRTLSADAVNGAWSVSPAADLLDGQYAVLAMQSDTVGNTSTSGVHVFTVDATAPSALSGATVRSGYSFVILRWTRGLDWKPTDQLVIRRRIAGGSTSILRYRGTGTSYADTGVKNGVTYVYDLVPVDAAGNKSAALRKRARPTGFLSPRNGAVLSRPPVASWVDLPNSTYSNIQVWNASVTIKMLSVWPTGSRFALGSRWTYRGHVYALRHGRKYRIYGWPGFGAKSEARYGKPYGWVGFTYQ